MISSRSRYVNATITKVAVDDDVRQTLQYPTSKAWVANFTYHSWKVTDRPDLLAQEYFSDATLWWTIARVNPEILDWHDIAVGTVIRIPSA